nr:MAG TPA: beta clamp protein [Caudoviricetes sp.]
MLSCIDAERTKLTFNQPNSAILIMPEKQQEGQELTYLLMPMTIQ